MNVAHALSQFAKLTKLKQRTCNFTYVVSPKLIRQIVEISEKNLVNCIEKRQDM